MTYVHGTIGDHAASFDELGKGKAKGAFGVHGCIDCGKETRNHPNRNRYKRCYDCHMAGQARREEEAAELAAALAKLGPGPGALKRRARKRGGCY